MFLFIILGVPGILAHTVPKEVTKVPQAEGREKKKRNTHSNGFQSNQNIIDREK